jgi:hypothetical protein
MSYSIKKNLHIFLLACFTSYSFASMKIEAKNPEKKPSTGSKSMALGATLPKGVFRANVVTFLSEFDSQFNKDGKREFLGSKININGMAFALEYGATDKLSLQFKMPVVMYNKLSYDPKRIKDSVAYDKVLTGLKKQGVPIASDTEAQITKNITDSFQKHSHGITGVGDIEVGALYNWVSTDRFLFSTGLGLRMPTGKYYTPIMQRPIGGGLWVLGFQNNFDVSFLNQNLWLSLRHQGEIAMSKAKAPKEKDGNSLLGELEDSDETFSKEGLTHKVTLQSSGSFGALSPHLRFLSTSLGYQFDSAAPTVTKVATYEKERSNTHSVIWNISASALPYKIPLALDVDLKKPLGGTNAGASQTAMTTTMNLKVYFKF